MAEATASSDPIPKITQDHIPSSEMDALSVTDQGKDGGKGKRGGKSGRGGRAPLTREITVSKALSFILRHGAEKEGLVLDAEGFANVEELLKWNKLKSLKVNFAEIQTAVADNAKQRFTLKARSDLDHIALPDKPGDWLIRANQGHSIAIDSAALLKPITLEANNVPDIVVHGTYYGNYQSIIDSGGLKKMGRNHVHFSTGLPEDKEGVISGMRSDAEILIYVDVKGSLEQGSGLSWWLSDNGVVLTEGDGDGLVATKWWKKVVGRRQDVGVLWEDGVQVAELPQSVRDRKPPSGKGPRGKREGEKSKGKGGRAKGAGEMKELNALGGEEVLNSEAA